MVDPSNLAYAWSEVEEEYTEAHGVTAFKDIQDLAKAYLELEKREGQMQERAVEIMRELREVAKEKYEYENRPTGLSILLDEAADCIDELLLEIPFTSPVDMERYTKNAQDETDDPCGECGHQYYRHFDWGDDYYPHCKYCPCQTFQEVR